MIPVPAVGLGVLILAAVVFSLGYVVTTAVLSQIAKRRPMGRKIYRDTLHPVVRRDHLTKQGIVQFSIAGGFVAVGLVALLLLTVFRPAFREHSTTIWIVLTVLGVLGGIATFVLSAAMNRSEAPRRYTRSPSASTRRPPSTPRASRPAQDDPCQTLLVMARHDQSLVDRLVEYERQRMPDASREELCKSAMERWRRANR